MQKKRIAIIGGGAAGYFAAIHAAKNNPDAEVSIYEATNKVLSKVLISGGGRCNVTTSTFDPRELIKKYPRGGRELLGPFNNFGPKDTVNWFESSGVKLKVEDDGRIFPVSNKSKDIAECLINEATKLNIRLFLKARVLSVVNSNNNYKIQFINKTEKEVDKLILATGSSSNGYDITKSLNHTIVKPVPSLFTFKISNPLIEGLSGLSFKEVLLELEVCNKKFRNTGPLLITHWGLSGPAVIVLSSLAARELNELNYNTKLRINFLNDYNQDSLTKVLLKQKEIIPKKSLMNSNIFEIPKTFWERVLNLNNIQSNLTWADVSKKSLNQITETLLSTTLDIQGKGQFKEEFVTAGGVDLKEVNFKTMESKISKGLFFAGEILDIDGVTGGFNFQAAWTTGFIAGCSK